MTVETKTKVYPCMYYIDEIYNLLVFEICAGLNEAKSVFEDKDETETIKIRISDKKIKTFSGYIYVSRIEKVDNERVTISLMDILVE